MASTHAHSLLCVELTTVLNLLRIVLMSLVTRSAHRRRPALAISLLLGLAASALTGCSAFSDDGGGSGSSPRVVAAFYPLQYAAERVAGDRADVENLTQPGQEPHDLELSIKETALITDGSLVVFEKDFQPAVDASIEQNAEGEVLDVTEAADLVPVEEHEGHEEESEHADEGEHTEESEHTDEGEEEHDHGDLDPHFWLDPVRMADVADAIADALSDVDPDQAEEYAPTRPTSDPTSRTSTRRTPPA
jgi:zinc transport system substrate-binding protein